MSSNTPPPTIDEPLPRAADAYADSEKWREWIFTERGHGSEWARVFHVGLADTEMVWTAITEAILGAPIHKIVDRGQDGVVCGVDMELTIASRRARVRTSWHYEYARAAPRLVTAYPRL
ncbi:MAG TPA: hypothetical protein VIJ39_15520 [Solirubrobacteraceae bacterium]